MGPYPSLGNCWLLLGAMEGTAIFCSCIPTAKSTTLQQSSTPIVFQWLNSVDCKNKNDMDMGNRPVRGRRELAGMGGETIERGEVKVIRMHYVCV